jgi:RNA polymerase sigma-70 factor (ECF subfamily)
VQLLLMRRALRLTKGNVADAEDLVGDTMLYLVQKPPRARSLPQLRAWLLLVLRHRFLDQVRERRAAGPILPLLESIGYWE